MVSEERSRVARRRMGWRFAWWFARWVWFPVLVGVIAGQVNGTGTAVLLCFLGLLWAGERMLAVRRTWRELRRWPSWRAAANSLRVRAAWPVVAADLGVVDCIGEVPHLVEVAQRPYGADLVLDVNGDGAAVRSLEDVRGALGRWLGVPDCRVVVDRPGRIRVEARAVEPLAASRAATTSAEDAPGVVVKLGRFENGDDFVVDLAAPWHVACQGMTRSGKSVLTYSLLSSVASRRDVVVGGVDPTGILLGPWERHIHREIRATGTYDMEAAANAVMSAVELMDSRIAGLHGRDKIGSPTESEPLIVFVLEEYPGVLAAAQAEDAARSRKPAERVASRIRRGVQRLVLEGAKVGVRVVLLAQRMDADIVGGAERSSLGARISLRVDNSEAVRMLHPTAPSDVVDRMSTALPGMAYVDLPGEPGRWAKADLIEYSEYRAVVEAAAADVEAVTADV